MNSRWLLICATGISAVSTLWFVITGETALANYHVNDYLPILMGAASMWLCVRAYQHAQNKRFVVVYSVCLAPFAFFYPGAAIIFVLAGLISGSE